MNFWSSAAGMLEVALTSAELETALSVINEQGIMLYGLEPEGTLTCRFRIRRKDYGSLEIICKRRGESLRVLGKRGLFWTGKALLKRPLLWVGMVIFFGAALYLPTRVLFVRVEGNITIPPRKIIAAAESCGIEFGASRREVRSEKMKNALLAAVPELQWAGVNTYGCVAVISVREGAEKEDASTENMVTSIVAARDGHILSGTATRGNALFQIGQTVKQGQLLISGYTDCGICIQATRAEGEIIAQTNRDLEVVTPAKCLHRGEIQEVKRKYSLLFRKKRINLWKDSGISDTSCGRMYEEYYVTLPGGFQLPFALCVEEYLFYATEAGEVSQSDAEQSLMEFSQQYVRQQMVAGSVLQKQEGMTFTQGVYRLSGDYICAEMIGRERREQIGETNGKSD